MTRIVVILIGMLLLVMATIEANPHSWYHHDCCSDEDCAPVLQSQSTVKNGVPGEMVTTKVGTVFVPDNFKKTRPSKDWQTHVCMTKPSVDIHSADLIAPMLICVYRPMSF